MNLSYRTRRFWRRLILVLTWLLVISVLAWGGWMIWVQRYIVYTPDGVRLDTSRSSADIVGEVATAPADRTPVPVHFIASADSAEATKLEQILGFHITTDALLHDIDAVSSQLDLLSPGSAVMIDLKSIYGNFFYSTDISGATTSGNINTAAMDRLIQKLTENDYYVIARLPAFRDMNFDSSACLQNEDGYPWHDSEYCIWLDPTNSSSTAYLIQICSELRDLGFDEVVFYEFRFPENDGNLVFDSDLTKEQAIAEAASQLVSTCSAANFAVSFEGDSKFALPEGRSRLYLRGVSAEQVSTVAAGIPVTDPSVNLVFLATSNDTRYNAYSALREIDVGQNNTEE